MFHLADNRAFTYPIGAFDVVITDPQYGDHVQRNLLKGNRNLKEVEEVAAPFDPLANAEVKSIVDLFVPAAKRWALFCCDLESLGTYRAASVATWVRSGIYCKARAMPQLSGDRPGNRCEGISIHHAAEGRKRWNGKGSAAFWRDEVDPFFFVSPENRSIARHPTGKPLLLALALVELFSDPGETVFDPFCGSGSFGIACALLGRKYVGFDINPEYIASAKEKLALALSKREEIMQRFALWKETKGL